MTAPIPGPRRALADKRQVGIVHQHRGLERLTWRLVGKFLCGQLSPFVVDQGQERVGIAGVELFPLGEICVK